MKYSFIKIRGGWGDSRLTLIGNDSVTVATKKKFPWVTYLLGCISVTRWMLFVFTDFELAFVSKDESAQIAAVLYVVVLLSAPRLNKKKAPQEKLSVWTKDIFSLTWSDFNAEFLFISLRWFLLLIALVSLLYSVGIEVILEGMSHNMISQLSLWAWFIVENTKSYLDWQKE